MEEVVALAAASAASAAPPSQRALLGLRPADPDFRVLRLEADDAFEDGKGALVVLGGGEEKERKRRGRGRGRRGRGRGERERKMRNFGERERASGVC